MSPGSPVRRVLVTQTTDRRGRSAGDRGGGGRGGECVGSARRQTRRAGGKNADICMRAFAYIARSVCDNGCLVALAQCAQHLAAVGDVTGDHAPLPCVREHREDCLLLSLGVDAAYVLCTAVCRFFFLVFSCFLFFFWLGSGFL